MTAEDPDPAPPRVVAGKLLYAPWLGEEPTTLDRLKLMLRPCPAERITMWPVDRRIENVKNEGADFAEPVIIS